MPTAVRAAWNGRQAGRDCAYFAWNYGITGNSELFLGLKLARFWSFLTVFVIGTGAAAAVAMQITSDETLSGIIGLAAGIILAIVFAILKRAGMFVTAFVLGAALSIYWLRPANLIWLLVCVGIGLVFALLTIKLLFRF